MSKWFEHQETRNVIMLTERAGKHLNSLIQKPPNFSPMLSIFSFFDNSKPLNKMPSMAIARLFHS